MENVLFLTYFLKIKLWYLRINSGMEYLVPGTKAKMAPVLGTTIYNIGTRYKMGKLF